ncbi:MAG: hypothetical protein IJW78_04060 [Clostridia bacterium]|nr:hypothetical protein [Clostridia bacterium]
MKRAVAFCFCLLLLLTGCAQKTTAIESEGFSCRATVKWQGDTYALRMEAPGGGIFKATVAQGNFKGMCFTLDADKVQVSYLGMEYTLPEGFTGQNCVVAFKQVMQALKRNGESAALDNKGRITLQTDMGNAEVTVRPDGFPEKIVLPEQQAEIALSEFNYLS